MAQEKEANGHAEAKTEDKSKVPQSSGIGFIDALRMVVGLLLLTVLGSYMFTGTFTWGQNPWWLRPDALTARLRSRVVLTDDQLLAYAGQKESLPIYLALNGTIYDVTAGRRIYGPGGPYSRFAGRDATLAYITGCFQEDSIADTRGVEWMFIPVDVPPFSEKSDEDLSPQQRGYRYEELEKAQKEVDEVIEHWSKVFRGETGKNYWEVGFVRRNKRAMERLPMRPLCKTAERKRPKARFDENKTYERSGARAKGKGGRNEL